MTSSSHPRNESSQSEIETHKNILVTYKSRAFYKCLFILVILVDIQSTTFLAQKNPVSILVIVIFKTCFSLLCIFKFFIVTVQLDVNSRVV